MKILFISPLKLWGGAAIANIAISKILIDMGHTVVFNNEYFAESECSGVPIDKTRFHGERKRWKKDLKNYVLQESFDMIIWDISMTVFYFSTIRHLKSSGVKNISIIHSLSLDRSLKGRMVDIISSISMAQLNGIVYVSNYTLCSWSKFLFIRNSKSIKRVIYNSVKCSEFNYPKKNIRGEIRLGFVGRFSDEKQPEVFCTLSSINQYELHAFGDGPLLNEMKNKYQNVIYHGLEKDQEKIYDQIDILVMTSKFENCPMVILEAMARGIPCVAPRVGGIPEIVYDGLDGRLYDDFTVPTIQNAISDVVSNYDSYARNALASVSKFSSNNIKNEWSKLLNEL